MLLRTKHLSFHLTYMKFTITSLLKGKLDENQSTELSLLCCEVKVDQVWPKKDLFLGYEEEASSLVKFEDLAWYFE